MRELERLIKKYIKGGFEYEVFWQRVKKTKIEVSGGEVESLSTSEETGIGLRVLKDGRIGFSYVGGSGEEKLREAVEKALQSCELQTRDEGNIFKREQEPTSTVSTFDKEGVGMPVEEKVSLTLGLEEGAKALDRRIKGVRKATLTEKVFEVKFFNSYGVSYDYEGTQYSASISALASEGTDSAISWEFRGSRRLADLGMEDIVKDVVFKATSLLNPRDINTAVMPVVFFRDSFAMMLSAFSDMFLGDSYIRGKTLLKDRRGERVGSELFTLVDDGTLEGGFSTFPYDAEGVSTTKTVLVERGTFKGFLHSLYTAEISGEKPTGNSVRADWRSLPVPGISNLYMEKGTLSFRELIGVEETALLVLDLMGLHTVDPISGEFSLGASGLLLKEGKPVHAVRGVTVAGNVLDMWANITAVGDDLVFYGSVGSPSVLVRGLTVGGS